MAEQGIESSGVELDAKQQKLRIWGADVPTLLTLVGVCVIAYVLWDHKSTSDKFVFVMESMVVAQRTTNCLISLPPERRENALQTCERIAR